MSDVPVYDISVYQGATVSEDFQALDDNELPMDLTGYNAALQVRTKPGGVLLLDLSSPSNGLLITPSTGTVTMQITATQCAALAFERGVYDLKVTSAGGVVKYLLQGEFMVDQRVTV
jgi:hypothetical protein